MLFTDHLDAAKVREVRKILHAESFGTNEVDIQENGTIFLNGYFTPYELSLIHQVAERLAADRLH
ncbi:hypothetical protein Q8A64_04685 [Oxalobacteraceae bacterium R-40]|uniref:BON domain-containing protein n=1 Tax=Keguizhuia sedimenti TaxID=3064264 RepID=A0ABU1BLK4_9BURK|nr:hypothetical protein [Oxalobacteraceae bacterium R-40]